MLVESVFSFSKKYLVIFWPKLWSFLLVSLVFLEIYVNLCLGGNVECLIIYLICPDYGFMNGLKGIHYIYPEFYHLKR